MVDNNGNNDDNDDNNNAEEQAVDDPDFLYRFNNSTYCIFCDNSTIATEYTLQLWDHPDLEPSCPLEMDSTVISSSLGLLLCYSPFTFTYFVGNPFTNLPYMWSRPHLRHITGTQSVLVADSNGYFHIISLIPTQQGIQCAIEIYSSHLGKWMTLSQGLTLKVVPNSGISCRRYGYWLQKSYWGKNIVWVVRVDTKPNVTGEMESPVLDYVQFSGVDEQDVVAGMKLGRVGNQVGLVIVNETKRRVELHIMNEGESVNGNEDDGSTDMIRWELFAEVHVDVDPTMDEAVVEIMEPLRIRCREMPQPIKFESGKMEVLLLAGRRLVVWQNGWNQESRIVAKVVSCEVPTDAKQYLAINGVSHVASSIELRVQDKQINDVPNVASSVVPRVQENQ